MNRGSLAIPLECDVLIIGGGPAGSSVATYLAKAGFEIVLLERAKFPRPQVGESLIPHFWKFTDLLGVTEAIEQEGFLAKSGGITAWDGVIQQIQFSKFGFTRPGLHVERDIFDDLLLRHSESCGAAVFESVNVQRVDFTDNTHPNVNYLDKRGDLARGSIACKYVVDASGYRSMLAHQLNVRTTVSSEQKFLGLWGYYKNSKYVGVDQASHTADQLLNVPPVTFVMSYEDGWIWHIILREKTSVGLIIHTDKTKGMGKEERETFYKHVCTSTPYLKNLLEPASFIEGSLQFRPDYSFYSKQSCGDNYYCIGDASAFADPIYSHGVQNAFYNAALAGLAIEQSMKDSKRRSRYSKLCESRMQQFYGFSRALSLGDFGGDGVDPEQIKSLMKSIPSLELELMLAASQMTNRSENFRRIAIDSGMLDKVDNPFRNSRVSYLSELTL